MGGEGGGEGEGVGGLRGLGAHGWCGGGGGGAIYGEVEERGRGGERLREVEGRDAALDIRFHR